MSFIPPRSHVAGHERRDRRVRASRDDALDRMRNRGGDPTDTPDEPLICPSCRAEYDEGSQCFACDAPLVGASPVDPERNCVRGAVGRVGARRA